MIHCIIGDHCCQNVSSFFNLNCLRKTFMIHSLLFPVYLYLKSHHGDRGCPPLFEPGRRNTKYPPPYFHKREIKEEKRDETPWQFCKSSCTHFCAKPNCELQHANVCCNSHFNIFVIIQCMAPTVPKPCAQMSFYCIAQCSMSHVLVYSPPVYS